MEKKIVSIDYDKCINCATCTNYCLLDNFKLVDGKVMVDEGQGCILCMHCAAACPENAIKYNGKDAILSEEMPILHDVFPDDLKDFLRMRRSYREFDGREVPVELITEALDIASWAPSAKNVHTTRYYILTGQEKIQEIMDIIIRDYTEKGYNLDVVKSYKEGINRVFTKANTVIIAYAKEKSPSPETDTAIALTYAELFLQSRGIGSCWGGYLKRALNDIEELKKYFPGREGYKYYGCLLVGYPKENYLYIPERTKRPIVEIVK